MLMFLQTSPLWHGSVHLAPSSSCSSSCRPAPKQQAKVHGYKHGTVFKSAEEAPRNASKIQQVQQPQQTQLFSNTTHQDSSMQHAADSNGRSSKDKHQARSEQHKQQQPVGVGGSDAHGSNATRGRGANDSSGSNPGSSNSGSTSNHGSKHRSSQYGSGLHSSSQRGQGSKPKKPESQGAATKPPAAANSAVGRRPKSSLSSSSSSSPNASAPATQAIEATFPITQGQSPFYNIRLKTFQQLQHLIAVHGSTARISDITAVMSRLKHVYWASTEDKAALMQQLWQLLQPQLPHAAARHCAEAMLTASKLGVCPEGLYEASLQQFVARVDQAEARILSNAIYALATAPSSSTPHSTQQQVQDILLPAFLQKLTDANSQSVANVAYALGLFNQSSSSSSSSSSISSSNSSRVQLEQLLAAVDPNVWATAKPQELSNTLWVSGTLGAQVPPQHLEALISRVVQTAGRSGQASAQDISNSIYGLAVLQQQQQQQQQQQPQQTQEQQQQSQVQQQQQQLTEQQHQQLACAMLQKAPDPQAISGFLWATAKLGLQLQQQQVDQLIQQLLHCRPNLLPQSISLSFWGVATLERQVQQAALLQLLQHLAQADAEPQALSLSLWAAAKMQAEVPTSLLDQLYEFLAEVVEQANPQALSNALWAAAAMLPQPYIPAALLGEPASTQQQQQQSPRQQQGKKQRQQGQRQGKQQKAGQQQQQQAAYAAIVSRVPGMKPLELSNVALALALLNIRDMQILQPVYDAAAQYLEGCSSSSSSSSGASDCGNSAVAVPSSSSSGRDDSGDSLVYVMGPQALSNLCWAGAILDLRDSADQLRAMAHACTAFAASGHVMGEEEAVQLYQLHLWLTEQLGQQGLEGSLTPQQLQHCRASMQVVVRDGARASQLQQQVWEAAQLVPGLQQLQLEAVTEDGMMSVDIAAVLVRSRGSVAAAAGGVPGADVTTARSGSGSSSGSKQLSSAQVQQQQQGQQVEHKVAIEVDGPWHWRRPDRQPTGPTHFRNRLLAHRGYTVVTVPYLKWQGLREEQRVAYLQRLLQDACVSTCRDHSE